MTDWNITITVTDPADGKYVAVSTLTQQTEISPGRVTNADRAELKVILERAFHQMLNVINRRSLEP